MRCVRPGFVWPKGRELNQNYLMLGEPIERGVVLVHSTEGGFLELGTDSWAVENGQACLIGEATSVFDGGHLRWMLLDFQTPLLRHSYVGAHQRGEVHCECRSRRRCGKVAEVKGWDSDGRNRGVVPDGLGKVVRLIVEIIAETLKQAGFWIYCHIQDFERAIRIGLCQLRKRRSSILPTKYVCIGLADPLCNSPHYRRAAKTSRARMVAAWRLSTPSFSKMCCRCVFTVCSVTTSSRLNCFLGSFFPG
jgi:hypothetical protein